jgi:hypothetical protein
MENANANKPSSFSRFLLLLFFFQFLGLSAMHILFAREHNRIARTLGGLNAAWSGDRLFQANKQTK